MEGTYCHFCRRNFHWNTSICDSQKWNKMQSLLRHKNTCSPNYRTWALQSCCWTFWGVLLIPFIALCWTQKHCSLVRGILEVLKRSVGFCEVMENFVNFFGYSVSYPKEMWVFPALFEQSFMILTQILVFRGELLNSTWIRVLWLCQTYSPWLVIQWKQTFHMFGKLF